jgi:glutathione S-transferase
MILIELVTVLALVQYFVFGMLVGKARTTYGVHAPAVSGHPTFERFYRVQMNTLEIMVVFLPAMWLAARYWSPTLVASVGAIYLIGRIIYLRAYVSDPAKRSLGFALSAFPAVALLLASLVGVVLSALK